MSALGRVASAVAVTAGVVGAAVLGGRTALRGMTEQRATLQRYRELAPAAGDGPGDLLAELNDPAGCVTTDRSYSVAAADGVALYVEEAGPSDAPLTVIFSHGWTLHLGAWVFQRGALAGTDVTGEQSGALRMVFYDQRSHGRSSRAEPGHSTIDDLASDLEAVIATAAPSGPIALVGHSMGGMAILALATHRPDLVADRVRAVALLSTSADETVREGRRWRSVTGANPLVPLVAAAAGRYPRVVERGRSAGRDAIWLATRSFGFADPAVPAPLVDFADRMISATPVDVIADFAPSIFAHDQRRGLAALAGIPVLIAVGEKDRMTPPARSEAMARALPGAELLIVSGAGHMVPLERAEVITVALRRLLRRGLAVAGSLAPLSNGDLA